MTERSDASIGAVQAVFIHGIGCDRTNWRGQTQAVARVASVIAPDLPGHGYAERVYTPSIRAMPDFINGLDNRDGSRRVLIGHSMGCRVALDTTLRFPERIMGLVLIEGSLRSPPSFLPSVDTPDVQYARLLADFRGMFSPKTPERFRSQILERVCGMDRALLLALLNDMGAWDRTQAPVALRAVRVPVLAIQSTFKAPGSQRRPLGPTETSPWLDLVSSCLGDHACIRRVANCGHFVHREEPRLVSQMIVEFIRSL